MSVFKKKPTIPSQQISHIPPETTDMKSMYDPSNIDRKVETPIHVGKRYTPGTEPAPTAQHDFYKPLQENVSGVTSTFNKQDQTIISASLTSLNIPVLNDVVLQVNGTMEEGFVAKALREKINGATTIEEGANIPIITQEVLNPET